MVPCLVTVVSLLACGGGNTGSTPAVISQAHAAQADARRTMRIGWQDGELAGDVIHRSRATIPSTEETVPVEPPIQVADAGTLAAPTGTPIGLSACPASPAVVSGGTTRLSVATSRASGVAPLSVFFDATGTASSATDRPFHDLELRWNFGDVKNDSDSTWHAGSKPGSSRNVAIGPMAAHVYETPGSYVVSVFDSSQTVAYQCRITVDDPDVVFAGAATACFSNSTAFAGCPQGAQQFTTVDFSDVVSKTSMGVRRLLLRRGDVWQATATADVVASGPGLIGAFGTGERPVVRVAAGASPAALISFSSPRTPGMRDWRLMDVTLDGSLNSLTKTYGIGAKGGIDQLTLLRMNPNALLLGVMFTDRLLTLNNDSGDPTKVGHHVWDSLAIVDMDITNMRPGVPGNTSTYPYGTYLSAERLFYAGNTIDGHGTTSPGVSHNARFPYLAKAVISNNSLLRPGPSELSLKIHAPGWGTKSAAANGLGGGYTRWVLISDNKLVGSANAWQLSLGPQDAQPSTDERGRDIVLERNLFVAGPGTQSSQRIYFSDVTSRNNILNLTGATYHGGISVLQAAPHQVAPSRVRIQGNTFYSPDSADDFVAVSIGESVTDIAVENNLGYAPRDTKGMMVEAKGAAVGSLVLKSNTSNTRVDPSFAGPLSEPGGFSLHTDSYAKDAASRSSSFESSDFFGTARPVTRSSIGAIE
jgi:hypothetical protein